jgi:hypothetical protein
MERGLESLDLAFMPNRLEGAEGHRDEEAKQAPDQDLYGTVTVNFLHRMEGDAEPRTQFATEEVERSSLLTGRSANSHRVANDDESEKNGQYENAGIRTLGKTDRRSYRYGKSAMTGGHSAGAPEKGHHNVMKRLRSNPENIDNRLDELS